MKVTLQLAESGVSSTRDDIKNMLNGAIEQGFIGDWNELDGADNEQGGTVITVQLTLATAPSSSIARARFENLLDGAVETGMIEAWSEQPNGSA